MTRGIPCCVYEAGRSPLEYLMAYCPLWLIAILSAADCLFTADCWLLADCWLRLVANNVGRPSGFFWLIAIEDNGRGGGGNNSNNALCPNEKMERWRR